MVTPKRADPGELAHIGADMRRALGSMPPAISQPCRLVHDAGEHAAHAARGSGDGSFMAQALGDDHIALGASFEDGKAA